MGNDSAITLVCFDLGGVMLRICRSWAEGCAAAGIPVRDEVQRRQSEPLRRRIIHDYQTGRMDGHIFARRISEALDGLYLPHEIMAVHHAWLLEPCAGMEEIVRGLHAAGLETACLSNTNHEHWIRMADYPAVMLLNQRLASHLLGLHKPDPAIYRALERHTGRGGNEVVFFDDLIENVEAARQIGWRAHHIDPSQPSGPQVMAALRECGVEIMNAPAPGRPAL